MPKIFIGSIKKGANPEILLRRFLELFEVKSARILHPKNGPIRKGFAIFDLTLTAEACFDSLLSQQIQFEGKSLYLAKYLQGKKIQQRNRELSMKKIYVCNIPNSLDDATMTRLFSQYGEVETAYISRSNACKAFLYGFVTFIREEDALRCLEHQTVIYAGKQLKVKPFTPKALAQAEAKNKLVSQQAQNMSRGGKMPLSQSHWPLEQAPQRREAYTPVPMRRQQDQGYQKKNFAGDTYQTGSRPMPEPYDMIDLNRRQYQSPKQWEEGRCSGRQNQRGGYIEPRPFGYGPNRGGQLNQDSFLVDFGQQGYNLQSSGAYDSSEQLPDYEKAADHTNHLRPSHDQRGSCNRGSSKTYPACLHQSECKCCTLDMIITANTEQSHVPENLMFRKTSESYGPKKYRERISLLQINNSPTDETPRPNKLHRKDPMNRRNHQYSADRGNYLASPSQQQNLDDCSGSQYRMTKPEWQRQEQIRATRRGSFGRQLF